MECNLAYLLLILGLSHAGQEPGTVWFTPGFPAGIPGTGSAVVLGKVKASPDHDVRAAEIRYWIGGGVVNTTEVKLRSDGSFAALITGLKTGARYDVMIVVVEVRGNETQRLASLRQITPR